MDNLPAHKGTAIREAIERTVDAIWNAVGALIPSFKPDECANYFKAAGYEPD